MARACIFCGASPTTNAHIFRRAWIEKMVYPGGENFTHRHIRRGEGGFDQTWSPRGFDIKVNCVCVRCNGEWMERLDLDEE